MKVKIGQEIEFKENFKIETFGGRKIDVKEGDKGVITSNGFIEYISGNAKGIVQKPDDAEVEGYDCRSISKMILNRLNVVFGLEEFLENEEIDKEEIVDEIEDLLVGIL